MKSKIWKLLQFVFVWEDEESKKVDGTGEGIFNGYNQAINTEHFPDLAEKTGSTTIPGYDTFRKGQAQRVTDGASSMRGDPTENTKSGGESFAWRWKHVEGMAGKETDWDDCHHMERVNKRSGQAVTHISQKEK